VCKRIERFENRRSSGSDFRIDDIVIDKGTTVEAQDVLACSVTGIKEVDVYAKPMIGVFKIGSEDVPGK
jgi:molybdopterin biosynthesis enzyme